ncbi:MAG: DUF502 domain-containing protein [Chloroflexi bacterium]|nr:DUF502 domain-containing protein [Chloroflexota bacterium]
MAAPSPFPDGSRRHRLGPFHGLFVHFERTLGAGILVVLPIGITILFFKFFFDLLDPLLKKPIGLIPGLSEIPGLGFLALVALVYIVGIVASLVVGRRLIGFGHRILEVIPVFKSVYGTTRSAVELLSNTNEHRYSGVVLIDFPRPGVQSIGLITSRMIDTNGEHMLAVYIPTTPIPSSGFLVLVPESMVTRTDMSVDDAMKVIISGGILAGRVFSQFGVVAQDVSRSNH